MRASAVGGTPVIASSYVNSAELCLINERWLETVKNKRHAYRYMLTDVHIHQDIGATSDRTIKIKRNAYRYMQTDVQIHQDISAASDREAFRLQFLLHLLEHN